MLLVSVRVLSICFDCVGYFYATVSIFWNTEMLCSQKNRCHITPHLPMMVTSLLRHFHLFPKGGCCREAWPGHYVLSLTDPLSAEGNRVESGYQWAMEVDYETGSWNTPSCFLLQKPEISIHHTGHNKKAREWTFVSLGNNFYENVVSSLPGTRALAFIMDQWYFL